jgi:hypothetical protein
MEINHKPQTTTEKERKNPMHEGLFLLLSHLAISQPEVAKESKLLIDKIDEAFDNYENTPGPPPSELIDSRIRAALESESFDSRIRSIIKEQNTPQQPEPAQNDEPQPGETNRKRARG